MHLSNKETLRPLSKPAVYIKPCTHKHNKLEIKLTVVQVGSQKPEKMITKWKRGGWLHQWKLMWHPSIRRQFGSKAQSGEHLVTVVVLNDLPNSLQCHGVGVQLVGVHVVQRSWLWRVTCWPNQSRGQCGWWGTKTGLLECKMTLKK